MNATGARHQAVPPEVFAAFYDQSFPEVYRYLSAAVFGDRALAEDLTQETFASLLTAVREGRAETQSMPWLMGVARHKLIDHYRSTAREQRRVALVLSEPDEEQEDDQLCELENVDPALVVALLRGLSPSHRLVLVLKYLDEMSVCQIASEIGRSEHATESLLARARHALARSYREIQS